MSCTELGWYHGLIISANSCWFQTKLLNRNHGVVTWFQRSLYCSVLTTFSVPSLWFSLQLSLFLWSPPTDSYPPFSITISSWAQAYRIEPVCNSPTIHKMAIIKNAAPHRALPCLYIFSLTLQVQETLLSIVQGMIVFPGWSFSMFLSWSPCLFYTFLLRRCVWKRFQHHLWRQLWWKTIFLLDLLPEEMR